MLSIVGYLEAPCLPIAVSPNRLNSAMACKQKLLVKLRGSYCHPVIRFCASRTYAKTLARNSEHSANNSKSKASLEHITNDNIQKEKTHGTLENAVKISKWHLWIKWFSIRQSFCQMLVWRQISARPSAWTWPSIYNGNKRHCCFSQHEQKVIFLCHDFSSCMLTYVVLQYSRAAE